MENKKYTFKGTILKNIFKSDDFSVYAMNVDSFDFPDIKHNKYGNVSISGELYDLMYGVEYEIVAEQTTTKYGIGYKVINISRQKPTTIEDIKVFLEEILTPNQANTLIEHYPDIIDRVKNGDTNSIDLTKLKGIGEYTFNKIKDKIITNYYLMDLVSEFGNILSLSIIKKIYDKYSSIELLKEKLKTEPYTTLTRISGIGFKTADSIIIELQKENIINFGYDVKTSIDRCLSCLLHLLSENENDGHTKMNLADLRKACMQLVPACSHHFVEAVKSDSIYYNKDTMDVALKKTHDVEYHIAKTLLRYLKENNNVWDCDIEKYRTVNGSVLSDEQIQAVDNVCKYSISILNGAGGTGKSFSTQAVINMLKDHRKSFKLFSPTGKAAKVLADYTKESASTIHRGLGYVPIENWTFNADNKLCCDIVIIDEFSMVDIWLFKRVIDAIDFKTTKLLMIGDNAQLPSVSCGNLLHDFMETKLIPTVTLTKVFRYGEGGLMKVATDVRFCKTYLTNAMKSKMNAFGENKDYTFVDLASEVIPQNVVGLYKKLLDMGNSIENIQVLTAKNVGDCGTVVLNNMIQKVANPNYGSQVFMKIGDTTYFEGDLIIQKVNNYKAELDLNSLTELEKEFYRNSDELPTAFIANGETGIIKAIYNTYVIIDFDGVCVKYYRNDMTMIGLGYSITIHKSQGSSIDNVILCTPQSHIFMLNSNLLYVGLTRMRKRCYHLGTLSSVNQAIGKKANLTRHTFMQQLLLNMKEDECTTHEIPVEIIGDAQENIDSHVDNDLPWYTDDELSQMSENLF